MTKKSLVIVFATLICNCVFISCQEDLASQQNEFNTNKDASLQVSNPSASEFYPPKGEIQEIKLGKGLSVYMDEDSIYFIGDMIFSKEQLASINKSKTRSTGRIDYNALWPNKKIMYKITPTNSSFNFSTFAIQAIKEAMTNISNATDIEFIPHDGKSNYYLNFIPDTANFSPVGRRKGGNNIHLEFNIKKAGTPMHEIMHSLGFFHEQSRMDRDNYIKINWSSIEEKAKHNFQTFTEQGYTDGTNIGDFDFYSIMLYGSYDFSKDGKRTMEKLDGSPIFAQRDYLSPGDLEGLYYLYGPTMEIETETKSWEDNSSQDVESYKYVYSNYIYFYDKHHNRVWLQYPRLLIYSHTITYTQSFDNIQTSTYVRHHTIPAGSYYDYLQTEENKIADRDGVRFYYSESINILNN